MPNPWSNQLTNLIILTAQQAGFSGLFGYSPSPGHGNLVFSIAAVPGTDPYGNAYQEGFTAYNTSNGTWAQLDSGALNFANGGIVTNAIAGTMEINNANTTAIVMNNGSNEIALDANNVIVNTVFTTATLVVNGVTLTIPVGPPAGPSAAPSTYNQTWGQNITGVLNNIIATIGAIGLW